MSFQEMKEVLDAAYERNRYNSRLRLLAKDVTIIGDRPERRRIPALSGLSGIGKTACVTEFAAEKRFELIQLDCSYMPVSMLATLMHDAIKRIAGEKIGGCVLLVDNVHQADDEWRELFLQYAEGYLDAVVHIKDAQEPGGMRVVRMSVDEIPETLFIVGEQRPG